MQVWPGLCNDKQIYPWDGNPLLSVITSLFSLMTASFFVHASNSAITTLLAINVAISGGDQSDVAMIAASYSAGFLVGCFITPPHIRVIGLVRAFAAAAAAPASSNGLFLIRKACTAAFVSGRRLAIPL